MPRPPVSPRVEQLLAKPNPAVVATIRPDGAPTTSTTWYLWRDGRIMLSMDVSRKRLEYMRANPNVSVNVIDKDDMYNSVALRGRVVEFVPDEGLQDIDLIATHYLGTPYPDRDNARVTAWVEVEHWHIWESAKETSGLDEVLESR